MAATLTGNAFALQKALDDGDSPATVIVRDGSTKGTLFTILDSGWHVTDLDRESYRGKVAKLAVVAIGDRDQDNGLNQAALAIDMEVRGGEWVVDAEDVEALRAEYDDDLVVKWVQS